MSQTEDETPRIRQGRRVICRKQGPYHGKRGRVSGIIGGARRIVTVDFGESSMTDAATCFDPV